MLLESLALKKKLCLVILHKNKHFDFPFLSESNVLFKDDDFFKFEKKLNFLIKKKNNLTLTVYLEIIKKLFLIIKILIKNYTN